MANLAKCGKGYLGPEEAKPKEAFSIELSVNGQGCTATPDHDCLKEFDLKRGKNGPTSPLTIVAKMAGFSTDNYTLVIGGRPPTGQKPPKECPGTSCSYILPGYSALGPIPVEDDFAASIKWLAKKDRQRDKGGVGNLVDGIVARVYVHYPE